MTDIMHRPNRQGESSSFIDEGLIDSQEPFSQAHLAEIFKVSPNAPDRLLSRESGRLEFKESFNFGSLPEYARTMAAFANATGGYLVFGVGNNPRKLIGLKGDAFDRLDPEKLTEGLNEIFSPEIHWIQSITSIGEKRFGLIYSFSCGQKPVVAMKAIGKISEGDILYRYRGRTQRIRYAELRSILEEGRRQEQQLWMDHLRQIARIGVSDAAILDIKKGVAQGKGGTLIIDESLLDKIQFIREGEFNEKDGAPTVRVIGDAQVSQQVMLPMRRTVVRTRAILVEDIVKAFLNQEKVREPEKYITQICHETSAFLPVYYFAHLAKMTHQNLLRLVEATLSRSPAKERLLERIKKDECFHEPVSQSGTDAARAKAEYRSDWISGSLTWPTDRLKKVYIFKALRSLTGKEFKAEVVFPFLLTGFKKYYYDKNHNIADDIRRAICHVDCELFRWRLKNEEA